MINSPLVLTIHSDGLTPNDVLTTNNTTISWLFNHHYNNNNTLLYSNLLTIMVVHDTIANIVNN